MPLPRGIQQVKQSLIHSTSWGGLRRQVHKHNGILLPHKPLIMKPPIFVYGTLCSPQVLQVLLGRTPALSPARLQGHARYSVRHVLYPATIPTPHQPHQQVDGFLLQDLTRQEEKLLDWFEGDEYSRVLVQVHCETKSTTMTSNTSTITSAQVYLWKDHLMDKLDLDRPWCLDTFQKQHVETYLETTVRPCRLEMEQLGMTQE